jgi:L-ascorbate metabolism protein UlaG (beta-lactamase superfamily)
MTRCLVALLTGTVLAGAAVQAGPQARPVEISWHGQSMFVIRSAKGTTLVIDPHAIPEYGRLENLKADGVLMSHLHNDHTMKEVIQNHKDKDFKVIEGIKGKGKTTSWNNIDEKFKDFHIRSVPSYHDDMEGMLRGKNTIFVIEVDGWRIVHLGDLGHMLTDAQLKAIGPVDVLMIPVGGIYTLNGSEAKRVLSQLKPKEYVIPMHYGNVRYEDLLTVDEFLEDVPAAAVALCKDYGLLINKEPKENARFVRTQIVRTDNTLFLDRDPKRPRPLVTVLHWWPQAGKKKPGKDAK